MNVSKRGRETPNPRLTPANVQSVELKRRGVLTVDAAQKRAAVEAYAQNEATLRRTARRYSLCLDDAEDALQRERVLAGPAALEPEPGMDDWVNLLPAESDGPPERAEREETIARSREALQ